MSGSPSSDIQRTLGFPLPTSARRYHAWWSNDRHGSHIQARSGPRWVADLGIDPAAQRHFYTGSEATESGSRSLSAGGRSWRSRMSSPQSATSPRTGRRSLGRRLRSVRSVVRSRVSRRAGASRVAVNYADSASGITHSLPRSARSHCPCSVRRVIDGDLCLPCRVVLVTRKDGERHDAHSIATRDQSKASLPGRDGRPMLREVTTARSTSR